MKKLQPFDLADVGINEPFFIAHLYGCVLIGRKGEPSYTELLKALDNDTVLEMHLFNGEIEVYATRVNHSLVAYEPLEPLDVPDEQVMTRTYSIEQNKFNGYKKLIVKEYIDYDEDCMAYVKQTVLSSLER
ncbi:hypothetical protein [Sporosarcina limicola]|uniref:Uncharacterized protein n=1 Tax=Sporosarcina limicola TaxID=34101 RepID=A0A927MJ87_9BACL|nr:hypothetical protein [Sporosarcina limicola]MBE1555400.1 hypothetical protein [Sporosarcina limicola]